MHRKYGAFLLGLLLCLAGNAAAQDAPLPEKIELYYFYDELCASCEATEVFDEIAARELSGVRDQYPYALHRMNVYTSAGRERFTALCDEMALETTQLSLPVLIAGGRVFQGDEAIAKNLCEAFLVAGEDLFVRGEVYNPAQRKTGRALFDGYTANPDAVTVVYFYRITCDECAQAAPVIADLAATGAAEVIAINTRSGNNGERVAAFFDHYAVPDEDRMVPIAFTRDEYFAGYDAIREALPEALQNVAVGFAFPAGEE